ncbi:beta-1,3-galactosyltransferase brn [Folsomia candida]|uniref:Hexosyltransferase n=1 Tax=Folsomia candida TaxID=158441 RepID=A0A226DNC0_FOLCA|nr:beta-1,3-galactosyltransferase brn [Folsomia candida]XP_035712836.1 beta-1,3-galactosyltransferase brn [Folsomia candida]XP_035712837.1 beta-1,3-galactosyltransferase brn [Folsomia candida]XP_035712838.1 beta-1,3-galactosyltransferase brn [Folsomia candida]XP_035712839.1 beta-1,3-galactosyltransferase brn [Folsomia candida]XP_035712840.1 beta-1,3-galactosyltransferase brn [Folsomia candida]OXA46344.1 Beta-1,3-galactosyltransferase brn [Folsomia candida]
MLGLYLTTKFRRRPKTLLVAVLLIIFIVWEAGLDLMVRETSYSQFAYPLALTNDEFYDIVTNFREKTPSALTPLNEYYSSVTTLPSKATAGCENDHYLLILVKSAPHKFENRNAIRQTWKKPVPGISTKTVFFIGNTDNEVHHASLLEEEKQQNDIVRIQYADTYYNNTIKTVAEMRFAAELCPNFEYVILIDDDYYLSVRDLRQFTEEEYPKVERLYAGFTFFSKPLRHRFRNKWFIDLDEYPFAYFPKYVTAGNILMSKSALLDIYYATFFVKPFRFDDIYVAICAKKMGIEPIHSDRFKFWVESGDQPRKGLIAAHGYPPERLRTYWQVQKEAGFIY